MKYLKFTYVDAVTGVPITVAPAANGPVFPDVPGIEFAWARESQYPTTSPEFFGTCPDGASTDVPGVLAVLPQQDWEVMRNDEMRARVPQSVTMRQARLALLASGKLALVVAAIEALPEPQRTQAQIEWEYALSVRRDHPLIALMITEGLVTEAEVDGLFVAAAEL